jgi:hypothetical protein
MVIKKHQYIAAAFLAIFTAFNYFGVAACFEACENNPAAAGGSGKVCGNDYNSPSLILSVYLNESFETWLPSGWTRIIQNVNYTWNQAFNVHYHGSASAEILNDPAGIPQNEWLVSPVLDFSNAASDLQLSFWWFTSYYWHVSPYDNGDVEVLVSTNNGSTWSEPLWTEDLYGVFQDWTWYNTTLTLDDYIGEPAVKVAFRYIGVDGAPYYLDAIYIHDSGGILDHDVGALNFIAPGNSGDAGEPIIPRVSYKNFGTNTETFATTLTIELNGSDVYTQSANVASLAPGATHMVTYPVYVPSTEAIYILTATSSLAGDQNAANNELVQVYNTAPMPGFFVDFESGGSGFSLNHDWQYGTPTTGPEAAHSGDYLVGTLIDAQYTEGPLLSTLISPEIELGTDAVLTFWHWYETEETYDGGNVKISSNGGISWTLITPTGGYDGVLSTGYQNPIGGQQAFSGAGGGWVQEIFDISDYDGMDIKIKLDYGSDISGIDGDGWYIDDFHLNFTTVGIDYETGVLPAAFCIKQNYPNPFNARTIIEYSLPTASNVNITIYDLLGRKIATLINAVQPAGNHQIMWNAADAPSGIYFYKIEAGEYGDQKKMLLLK